MVYVITFLAGLINAFVWAWYIRGIGSQNKHIAALNDLLLLSLQYSMLQLWAFRANDLGIIIAWVLSNALGTYLITGVNRDKALQPPRDLANAHWHQGTGCQAPCQD